MATPLPCPDCSGMLVLVEALRGEVKALEITLENSRRSLSAQGKSLRKAREKRREAEKAVESKSNNTHVGETR